MVTEQTYGVCPNCEWRGEEAEFMWDDEVFQPEHNICPQCQSKLKIVKIQTTTIQLNQDKPKTEVEEAW